MSDCYDAAKRSAVMARVRSKNTTPELFVRRTLHHEGFRYGLHANGLPGSPDILLRAYGIAVFVNGCFWHGHDCPRGNRVPRKNRAYWERKIRRNKRRDRRNRRKLNEHGWKVRNVWECRLDKDVTRLLSELIRDRAAREEEGGTSRA